MKITFRDHDSKGARLARALAVAGYEIVDEGGDVLLIDADIPVSPYLELCDAHERVLLYPHGAGVLAHGDGQWPTHPHTIGSFVIGDGQAEVLRRCSYPRPVARIGWPFCDLQPFRASCPVRVLFAPQHVMADGWLTEGARERNARIHDLLASLPLGLTVRYVPVGDHDLESLGITPQPGVRYQPADFSVDDGLSGIETADVVIAEMGTFPSLAVARGCPTVMYGQERPDDHECESDDPHIARTWHRYADFARYPLDADQAHTPGELLELLWQACTEEASIAEWRARFIGAQFNPYAFVELFEKALVNW